MQNKEMELIINYFKANVETLKHNADMLEIYEGNLNKFILKELKESFHPQTYAQVKDRIAPINFYPKIINKLSSIYTEAPIRRLVGGNESDQQLFDWYLANMLVNEMMSQCVKTYNMNKTALLQPYVFEKMPGLRVYHGDKFFVMGLSPVDPMKVTHVVLIETRIKNDMPVNVFHVYTEREFIIFDEEKTIYFEEMIEIRNPDGINFLNAIPFNYATSSNNFIFPKPDFDVLQMCKLIPIMITDLNFAVKFQCFSIIYTIGVKDGDLRFSPNAVWDLEISENAAANQVKPELNFLKPSVDYEGAMNTVGTQFRLWLQTKGIRPGIITGDLNSASAVSKIVDEIDTYEARIELCKVFANFEKNFWNLLMHKMHPFWVGTGEIANTTLFSPDVYVEVIFPAMQPMVSKQEKIKNVTDQLDAGLMTRKMAIKELNPLITDDEIEKMLMELDDESEDAVEDNSAERNAADDSSQDDATGS